MNHKLVYNHLMQKAKDRSASLEYAEEHHIVPTKLGGSNDESNKVLLTYKEHYVAHHLLVKMQTNANDRFKMAKAFFLMGKSNNGKRVISARQFELAKKTHITEMHRFFSTPEGKQHLKTRAINRKKVTRHLSVFHFYHETYGEFLGATYELCDKYPEQNLNSSNLNKVGKLQRAMHKGWMHVSNKHLGVEGLLAIKHSKQSIAAKQRK